MKYSLLPVLGFILMISSCEKKESEYDRGPLLQNIGNNVIAPAYKLSHDRATSLKDAVVSFNDAPDIAKLQTLKVAFNSAYTAWQGIETYDFGAAESQSYSLNTFPCDTNKIAANIVSGTYTLGAAGNLAAKGFAAIDFLLYSKDESATVNFFTTNSNARKYLLDVTTDISSNITTAYDAWTNGGSAGFIAATALDAGSSISILNNAWAQATERTRRERVGNALGYIGLISSGNLYPDKLEGLYANNAKELLIANLEANKNLFTGGSGIGFDDYPKVKEALYQERPLNEEITNQFDKAIAASQAISGDFKSALINEKPKMETLFLELKKLTVLIKVDMASAIGVTINYTDNDGD